MTKSLTDSPKAKRIRLPAKPKDGDPAPNAATLIPKAGRRGKASEEYRATETIRVSLDVKMYLISLFCRIGDSYDRVLRRELKIK